MGLPLEVTLIPDLNELKKAKGKISQTISGGAGGIGGAGAKAGSGGSGGIMGILAGILASIGQVVVIATVIAGIVGAFLDLKPIKAILETIMKIISIVLLPFGLIIFALLKPFLIFMLRLLPYWMQFMGSFVEQFNKFSDILSNIGDYLINVIDTIINSFGGAKKVGSDVVDLITNPAKFAENKTKEFVDGYGKNFVFNVNGTDLTDSASITKLGNELWNKVVQYGMG